MKVSTKGNKKLAALEVVRHRMNAAGLGIFAFNSTVSSYTFDLELGVPVRSTESLGPILSERATTLGARRLNVGFSYNRIDFKRFEGTDLDDITVDVWAMRKSQA